MFADASADYSDLVGFAQDSDLSCGNRLSTNAVQLIELQNLFKDKSQAVEYVYQQAPLHGLESPIPLLIERAHIETKASRKMLLRDVMREAASRGCDLAIVLDIEVVEKTMFRPQLMELKLDVSYLLVLFGSQVKNSVRKSN